MRKIFTCMLLCSAIVFASCTEKENPDTDQVPVSSVKLDKTLLGLDVGAKATLIATVMPENASNKSVQWSSSNKEIATVSETGEVAGLKAGTVVITATTISGGYTASCNVAVLMPVTGITLDKPTLKLAVNSKETLKATIAPENAGNKGVKWSSSDDKIAKVSETGEVTAVAVGEATITVTTIDGGKTATCKVTVVRSDVAVTDVTLNNKELYLVVNTKETLTATVTPENAGNKTVTWSSSDDKIAKVSETGEVTAVAVGEATITATTIDGGKTATCKVTVTNSEVPATGISINKLKLKLNIGTKETLYATVTPQNATNKNVTWSSSNPEYASVSPTGEVSALSAGDALTVDVTITATCAANPDLKAECIVTISRAR